MEELSLLKRATIEAVMECVDAELLDLCWKLLIDGADEMPKPADANVVYLFPQMEVAA